MRLTDDWMVGPDAQPQSAASSHVANTDAGRARERKAFEEFSATMNELRIEAPRAVFYEDDPCEFLYVLTEGNVMLSKMLFDGRRQVMGFKTAGDIFGFSVGDTYAYSVEPLGRATVRRCDKKQLAHFCRAHREAEAWLLDVASRELLAAQDHILLLGRKTAVEKVATFLLLLSGRAARRAGTGNPVVLSMTRAQIGDYLGITLETVSRALSSMAKCGVIEILRSNTILLRNQNVLKQIAEGDGTARTLVGAE